MERSRLSEARNEMEGRVEANFMPYFVYILECNNNSFYTGITSDIDRRMKEHFSGKGCKYTAAFKAKKMRYVEEHYTRSRAAKREAQIKGWTRTKKLALIKGYKSILKAASKRRSKATMWEPSRGTTTFKNVRLKTKRQAQK